MRLALAALCLTLSGCGLAYITPSVSQGDASGLKVRVVPMTAETVAAANRTEYRPRALPAAFSQTAGSRGLVVDSSLPEPVFEQENRPLPVATRLPPPVPDMPYTIGVGDVLILATPSASDSLEQLSGLLAAQNRRQGYTVQDDGAIAVPDVGRIPVAGQTLEEAEAEVFQALVQNQIDPTFSLEIVEFNSKRVSVGGAVKSPTVTSISLTPLFLDQALAATGGVTAGDLDYTTVRIYREGSLYQIPLRDLYSDRSLQQIRLQDGDSIFVDTEYELNQAQSYFAEQIALTNARRAARAAALSELQAEVSLRRNALQDQRDNFQSRLQLGAVKRDAVFLTGEVKSPGRFTLPFEQQSVLADALYSSGGIENRTANSAQIYVLRGSTDPLEFSGLTAYQLNSRNAASILLATRFTMQPNDIIFVAEQPVTRWNRVVNQIVPSLISTTLSAATGN